MLKILSCISPQEIEVINPTNNSDNTEINKKFSDAVQCKIDALQNKAVRNKIEENLLKTYKLIMEKIPAEINATQENRKTQVEQKTSLPLQVQLQTVSPQPEKKTNKQSIVSDSDLRKIILKKVKKLDYTSSENKSGLSELEKKLAKQRMWEETNNSTSEKKSVIPLKIEIDSQSKSFAETKDKIQFTGHSECEKKAINLLNLLQPYLERDEFENITFHVMEDICNGFNEQKLQEFTKYGKEIKNRFFYGKINEIFQTLISYLDASEIDEIKNEINAKYVSNDLNEHDLNNIKAYATEKMNFPVEIVHRFSILSTIIEEPENRRTLKIMDELDNLLRGLQEFTKEPEQTNYSQPTTCQSSFFPSSTNSKESNMAGFDDLLPRP